MAEFDGTPDQILRISAGYMAAKFLFVASRIGLFETLAQGPHNWAPQRACRTDPRGSSPTRW